MKNLILHLYPEYGRFISRFRMPFRIDGFRFSERRLLLVLYKLSKGAHTLRKSSKVIGDCLGDYHPHGPDSLYKTLVNLAHSGYVEEQGNWGGRGLIDSPPAAFRYTECKIEKWVKDLAFKYIDHVPWDVFQYGNEPLALPCPVPIGLIGSGFITGISFYHSLIPKYKIEDLANRLLYLFDTSRDEPIIEPYIDDCLVKEIKEGEFKKILTTGRGKIRTIPKGDINIHKGKQVISIKGRSPIATFDKLHTVAQDKKFPADVVSGDKEIGELVRIIPYKKTEDVNRLMKDIWEKYLIKNHDMDANYTDDHGVVDNYGVDQIIINSFNFWRQAVFTKRLKDCYARNKKYFEGVVEILLKDISQSIKINNIDDILNEYNKMQKKTTIIEEFDNTSGNWVQQSITITGNHIKNIYENTNKSFKRIIESPVNLNQLHQKFIESKQILNNLDIDCYNEIVKLT